MAETDWWFGFRQTLPRPPGQAIAVGPFGSYEDAERESTRSRAWDCDVSAPYAARSKDEAEARAKVILRGPGR